METPQTREEVFDQDRGERAYYSEFLMCKPAQRSESIFLPLTKDGFEALMELVCEAFNLPLDDGMRSVLAGYVHHLSNETNTSTIDQLGKVLWKSVSNVTTWRIDQDIKIARNKAIKEKHDKEQADLVEQEKLTAVAKLEAKKNRKLKIAKTDG